MTTQVWVDDSGTKGTDPLFVFASISMTAEECDDPDRIVALINRCGGDCIWDYEAGRVVPRPRDVSP